jgi:hypothetical protein
VTAALCLAAAGAASAQATSLSLDRTSISFDLKVAADDAAPQFGVPVMGDSLVEETYGKGGNRLRRSLLIGGLATSMAAYGYFILEFNNSRGDADVAERAYETDVRENAQSYLDQGIALDEIQTFTDWQSAYDDAKRSREWAARAGFLAIVIGFFAVLDAATSYDGPPPTYSDLSLTPALGLAPDRETLLVGARVRF